MVPHGSIALIGQHKTRGKSYGWHRTHPRNSSKSASTGDNEGMNRLLLHLHAAETRRYQSALIALMEAVMMGKVKDSEIVAAIRKATGHYTMARAYEHALEIQQRREEATPPTPPQPLTSRHSADANQPDASSKPTQAR